MMGKYASVGRLIFGLLLTIFGLGYLLLFATQPAQADNITVSAVLNQSSSLTLAGNSVTLNAGNPGQTVNTESTPLDITVKTNTLNAWSVQISSSSANLTSSNGDTIPIGTLQWKATGLSSYTPLSTTPALLASGTGPTNISGNIYQLMFSLTYPWGKKPGTYSAQVVLTFS